MTPTRGDAYERLVTNSKDWSPDPETHDASALNRLGAALSQMGRYREAEPHFRRPSAGAEASRGNRESRGSGGPGAGNADAATLLRRALKASRPTCACGANRVTWSIWVD